VSDALIALRKAIKSVLNTDESSATGIGTGTTGSRGGKRRSGSGIIPGSRPAAGAGNKLRGTSIASLKVSPDWEEWLMGFPPGWTRISDKLAAQLLEKQLSRSRPTRSSKRLQTLKGAPAPGAGSPIIAEGSDRV